MSSQNSVEANELVVLAKLVAMSRILEEELGRSSALSDGLKESLTGSLRQVSKEIMASLQGLIETDGM